MPSELPQNLLDAATVTVDPLHSRSRIEFWKLWAAPGQAESCIPAEDFLPGVNSELEA